MVKEGKRSSSYIEVRPAAHFHLQRSYFLSYLYSFDVYSIFYLTGQLQRS